MSNKNEKVMVQVSLPLSMVKILRREAEIKKLKFCDYAGEVIEAELRKTMWPCH